MINPQVLDSMDASTMEKRRNTLPPPPWGWDAWGIVKYRGSVGYACEGCPFRYCGMLTAYGAGRMFCSDCELIGWREASGEG